MPSILRVLSYMFVWWRQQQKGLSSSGCLHLEHQEFLGHRAWGQFCMGASLRKRSITLYLLDILRRDVLEKIKSVNIKTTRGALFFSRRKDWINDQLTSRQQEQICYVIFRWKWNTGIQTKQYTESLYYQSIAQRVKGSWDWNLSQIVLLLALTQVPVNLDIVSDN